LRLQGHVVNKGLGWDEADKPCRSVPGGNNTNDGKGGTLMTNPEDLSGVPSKSHFDVTDWGVRLGLRSRHKLPVVFDH